MRWPWMSKKKHDTEMDKVGRDYVRLRNLTSKEKEEDQQRLAAIIRRVMDMRGRHPRGGDDAFTIQVRFSAEMLHHILGNDHGNVGWITNAIGREAHGLLTSLCGLTKVPKIRPIMPPTYGGDQWYEVQPNDTEDR